MHLRLQAEVGSIRIAQGILQAYFSRLATILRVPIRDALMMKFRKNIFQFVDVRPETVNQAHPVAVGSLNDFAYFPDDESGKDCLFVKPISPIQQLRKSLPCGFLSMYFNRY